MWRQTDRLPISARGLKNRRRWVVLANRTLWALGIVLVLAMLTMELARHHTADKLRIEDAVLSAKVWLFDHDPKWMALSYRPIQMLEVVFALASLRWSWRSTKRDDWTAALGFLVIFFAGFIDLTHLRGESALDGFYLLVHTSATTLMIAGLGLLGALALTFRQSRYLTTIIQEEVAQRETELARVHEVVLETQAIRVRAEERERIIRDMHDGFMSTLALTRIALDSGQILPNQAARLVRDCQDDLRLVLDATGSTAGSLEELLVDHVYRFQSRMANTGIEQTLRTALDGMPAMSSTSLIQVMRIVQESVNNAIRHSTARRLDIGGQWNASDQTLRVWVTDDGQGMPDVPGRQGRGLGNMRVRAKALGGQLEINSTRNGTRVLLHGVPIGNAKPSPS